MPGKQSRSVSEILQAALTLADKSAVGRDKVKLLMAEILGSLPALPLSVKTELRAEQEQLFNTCFQRLLRHEPLQYILGSAEFYGLKLKVTPAVLIPRPETEGLVAWVLQDNPAAAKILDIGTGSGAIALALKFHNPSYRITATDVSQQALQIAKQNAEDLHLEITLVQADIFPDSGDEFDIIVSNPPYISSHEMKLLPEEVAAFEPLISLLAGEDGLEYYRRILTRSKQYLRQHGRIYFEIGEKQASALHELASELGYHHLLFRQDLASKDRYLRIIL